MEISRKMRKALAILLAAGMLLTAVLLPACSGEPDKSMDSSTDSSTDVSPEASPKEPSFRSLTEEEAAALFGTPEAQAIQNIDGDYLYFVGELPGKTDSVTMYRYHTGTGEIQYACQDPDCTHEQGSDCPFSSLTKNSFSLCAVNGGVAFHGWLPRRIEWYNPGTGEHKVFEDENVILCEKVGDGLYITKLGEASEENLQREHWRFHAENGTAELMGKEESSDRFIYLCLLDGEETVLAFTYQEPEGKTGIGYWIYRIDEENGERSLLCDRPIPGYIKTCGKYFFYIHDIERWSCTDNFRGLPTVLHVVDTSTWEDKILDEDSGQYRYTVITDSRILSLKEDPDGNYAYILYSYDYRTGEQTTYPLKGDAWEGYDFMYYQGQVYLTAAEKYDRVNGGNGETADLVVWDIASGNQRVITAGEIVSQTPLA